MQGNSKVRCSNCKRLIRGKPKEVEDDPLCNKCFNAYQTWQQQIIRIDFSRVDCNPYLDELLY
jgi:hypothetical protein